MLCRKNRGHDQVARTHQARDHTHVDAVTGREQQHGFLLLEGREPVCQLVVDLQRPAEDGRAGCSVAVTVHGLDHRLLDLRPIRQTEVIVGGEVQEVVVDLPALRVADVHARLRRSLQRKSVQVVSGRLGVLPPLCEGVEHRECVVPGAEVEVGVVVLHRERQVTLVGELWLGRFRGFVVLAHDLPSCVLPTRDQPKSKLRLGRAQAHLFPRKHMAIGGPG